MVEIQYMLGQFGGVVFAAMALICLLVGAIGFKFDKPCVVVVSLILGFGIGYFVSMAAWDEGIGTVYIGSCIGLLSLLVSTRVIPVKRFFLGGVSIFLSVTAVLVILINAIGGTTATYKFQALVDGVYTDVSVPELRNNDFKKAFVEITRFESDEVSASLNDGKTELTITMPAANLGQLEDWGDSLAGYFDGVSGMELVDYSSAWMISIIIAAVIGIAAGIFTMFKPKIMQIVGTSVFAGVFGSVFAYLGLGELACFILAPIVAVGAVFLQRVINVKKTTDITDPETDYKQELPTV